MGQRTKLRIPSTTIAPAKARLGWLHAQASTLRRKLAQVEGKILALSDEAPAPDTRALPRCCCRVHEVGTPCCPGWIHMSDPHGIERCDECQRFSSDDVAQAMHEVECGCGWEAGAETSG